jgi:hypothetical protein
MTRIFLTLALLDGVALLASTGFGIASKLRGAFLSGSDPTWMIHFYLGLLSAMGTLLVHCLIFTYFLGTGRWVKEVGLAYELPDVPLLKLTRDLKRRTFPVALFAMLLAIGTAAAGAGAQLQTWPWGVHVTLAGLTLLINGWAFVIEYRNVHINGGVIDDVLEEVDRIRAARGLPSNEEAWREEQHGELR